MHRHQALHTLLMSSRRTSAAGRCPALTLTHALAISANKPASVGLSDMAMVSELQVSKYATGRRMCRARGTSGTREMWGRTHWHVMRWAIS